MTRSVKTMYQPKIYRINTIGEIFVTVQHEYPLHLEALQKLSKHFVIIMIIITNVCISGSKYPFKHVICYDYIAVNCTTIRSRKMFF